MHAYLLLVVLCIVCAICTADAQQYSVIQRHEFYVHDSGKVDVLFSIVFQLSPGAILSHSYKSILSETSFKTVENGVVNATDLFGRSLEVATSDRNGWLRADFVFPEVINGSITQNYTVNLEYRILQSICASGNGFEKLSFPWAHRWAVDVTKSRYIIKFSKVMKNAMDTVCIGSTGWRSFCGKRHLKIDQTTAEYAVDGVLYGGFFEWASPLDLAAGHLCEGAVITPEPTARLSNVPIVTSSRTSGEDGSSHNSQGDSSHSTALIIVLTITSVVCLFAATMLLCALKVPIAPRSKRGKLKKKKGKPNNDVKLNVQEAVDISRVKNLAPLAISQSRSARENTLVEASLASKRLASASSTASTQRNRQSWPFLPRSLPSILPIARRAHDRGLRGAAEVGRHPSNPVDCSEVVVQDEAPGEDPWAVLDEFIEEDGIADNADNGAGVWDDDDRKNYADTDKDMSVKPAVPTVGVHASSRMSALGPVAPEQDDSTREGTVSSHVSMEDNERQTSSKADEDQHADDKSHWVPDDEFASGDPSQRDSVVTNTARPAGVTSHHQDKWESMVDFCIDDAIADDAVVQPKEAVHNATLFGSARSPPVALEDEQHGTPQSSVPEGVLSL